MAGAWFQSWYEQATWHRAIEVQHTVCKKCNLVDIVGLCGSEPDFPLWTDNPAHDKRCCKCVSLLAQSSEKVK